jgi:hypothetical protein
MKDVSDNTTWRDDSAQREHNFVPTIHDDGLGFNRVTFSGDRIPPGRAQALCRHVATYAKRLTLQSDAPRAI